MTLMLAADEVELFAPGPLDGHGWREPPEGGPFWTGRGNLQLFTGRSDPRAGEGGGRGPFGPAAADRGTLYLPPGLELSDGCAARIRGRVYVLSQVRLVIDPIDPGGALNAWAATVTGWPAAEPEAEAV